MGAPGYVNLLLGTRLKDMTSGFELFNKKALSWILDQGIYSTGPFFQTEIRTFAHKLKIIEVPITFDSSTSHFHKNAIVDSFKNLKRLFVLRLKNGLDFWERLRVMTLKDQVTLVVTTISKPNKVLKSLSKGCQESGWDFIIVGDISSPKEFALRGSDYYDIDRQIGTGFLSAKSCLTKHYARKNVSYLIAMAKGAKVIVETDDDNFPKESFWQERCKNRKIKTVKKRDGSMCTAIFLTIISGQEACRCPMSTAVSRKVISRKCKRSNAVFNKAWPMTTRMWMLFTAS